MDGTKTGCDSTEVVYLGAKKREIWCNEGARFIPEGVHIEKHWVIGVQLNPLDNRWLCP